MTRHLLLERYCVESGYTIEAIRKKIERGDLVKGIHFDTEGDRNIKIDTEAMSLWAMGVPANVILEWKRAAIQSVYDSTGGAGGRKRSNSSPLQQT